MFGTRYTLFHVFGFAIRIDSSWFFLAFLIVWSLATGYFPQMYPGLEVRDYWSMGVLGAFGLFASIVLHELSHAVVAKSHGVEMKGITLFIFGGVAEMKDEPKGPKSEFLIAIAGPIASFFVAAALFGIYVAVDQTAEIVTLAGALDWLVWINLILAGFNLVPAFPLDGGRVLRAVLWAWKGRLRWATRITAALGSAFGFVMIGLGILSFFAGQIIGGLWWCMLGLFVRQAARMSYEQLVIREILQGEKVQRFMRRDPIIVPASISISRFVDDFVFKHHFKMYPVWDGQGVGSFITTRRIRDLPRENWESTEVRALAERMTSENTVSPEDDAIEALKIMRQTGMSRLLVVHGGTLAGVITLKDLLNFFSLKMDLNGDDGLRTPSSDDDVEGA